MGSAVLYDYCLMFPELANELHITKEGNGMHNRSQAGKAISAGLLDAAAAATAYCMTWIPELWMD